MRKLLLSILLLCFSSSFLYANRYFEERHISENRYFDTLGYGVGELLESKECPNCVEYDISDVYGSDSEEILQNTRIFDVTIPDAGYGIIRIPNIHDRVSLPPHSSLDVIYWSFNLAQKDVNITKLYVFLSRGIVKYGDLRKVLYTEGEYREIPITYLAWYYPRFGIVKEYPGIGVVKHEEGYIDGKILDRFYVRSPLEFRRWEANVEGDYAFLKVYVKNNSSWRLDSIVFNHSDYTNSRTFQPNEEHLYEYVISTVEQSNNLGYANIFNPNSQTQCAVLGENTGSDYVGDSPPVAGLREENGDYLEYIGSRVKPLVDSFCVTQIPYTLYSGEMVLQNNDEEITEEKEIISEEEKTFGEIFGIKKLPQTHFRSNNLLVVLSRLWYYLTRRLFR